jgi:DNA repair protein RadC
MNRTLLNRSPAELIAMATEIRGVCLGMTPNSVQRLMAGVEISLPIAELKSEDESIPKITSPATAIQYCRQQFSRLAHGSKQEEFWIVTLNTKNQPIECHQITVGTLRNSLVHPREVFRPTAFWCCTTIPAVIRHPVIKTSVSLSDSNKPPK